VDTKNLRIFEIFKSLEGEGPHVGTPTIFIRMAGCQNNCLGYCDTPKSRYLNSGSSYSTPEVLEELSQGLSISNRQVIQRLSITGGDPMLQIESILEFLTKLGEANIIKILNFEHSGEGSDITYDSMLDLSEKLRVASNAESATITMDIKLFNKEKSQKSQFLASRLNLWSVGIIPKIILLGEDDLQTLRDSEPILAKCLYNIYIAVLRHEGYEKFRDEVIKYLLSNRLTNLVFNSNLHVALGVR
jgi:organic radical activating enzyme